jgi:pSer/pThr/pTyr-binding forkhead associated (FHA) protein
VAEVFCNNCGHNNPPGSNFCSSCGERLDRGENEEPATITFVVDQAPDGGDELEFDLAEIGPGGVLIVTKGPNTGSEYALEHVITTVGRHPDSDIFLDDVTVSRRHVEVEQTGKGYVVRDTGSLNGTYRNHVLIEGDQTMTNGDELQIGRFKLVFVAGGEG